MDAQTARNRSEVDVGIRDAAGDPHAIDPALAPVGDHLHLHHFHVIGAVVMHDVEQRDALVRGGPKDARPEHEVTVTDDAHTEAAILLVG